MYRIRLSRPLNYFIFPRYILQFLNTDSDFANVCGKSCSFILSAPHICGSVINTTTLHTLGNYPKNSWRIAVLFCPKCHHHPLRFYEGHLESKERFAIPRYLLIIERKRIAGFITHLHLLLHIVILDIEALVVP